MPLLLRAEENRESGEIPGRWGHCEWQNFQMLLGVYTWEGWRLRAAISQETCLDMLQKPPMEQWVFGDDSLSSFVFDIPTYVVRDMFF